MISVSWELEYDTPAEYAANQFAGILYDLEQKYGEAESLVFSLASDALDKSPTFCQIEKNEAYIATGDIIKAYDEGEIYVTVRAHFRNLFLSYVQDSTSSRRRVSVQLLCASPSLSLRPEFAFIPDPATLIPFDEYIAQRNKGVGF